MYVETQPELDEKPKELNFCDGLMWGFAISFGIAAVLIFVLVKA